MYVRKRILTTSTHVGQAIGSRTEINVSIMAHRTVQPPVKNEHCHQRRVRVRVIQYLATRRPVREPCHRR